MSLPPEAIFKSIQQEWIRKWIDARENLPLRNAERITSPDFANRYRTSLKNKGWFRIENLIKEPIVRGLLACREVLEKQEVHVNEETNVTWLEYSFPDDQPVPQAIIDASELQQVLFEPLDLNSHQLSKKAWINCYRPGEYIPEHSDSEGIVQFLIGLQSPAESTQPLLVIEDEEVPLDPGDLLIFKASERTHWTRPVPDDVTTSRINAALRYIE
jgi:hypothetical protein